MTKLAGDIAFAYEDLANHLVPQGSDNSPVSGTKPRGLSLRQDVMDLRDDMVSWLARQSLAERFGGEASERDGLELMKRYDAIVSPSRLDDVFIDCSACYGRMQLDADRNVVVCSGCSITETIYDLVQRKARP